MPPSPVFTAPGEMGVVASLAACVQSRWDPRAHATHIWFQGSGFLSLVFYGPSLPGPDQASWCVSALCPFVGELAALPAALGAILQSPLGSCCFQTVAILLLPPSAVWPGP